MRKSFFTAFVGVLAVACSASPSSNMFSGTHGSGASGNGGAGTSTSGVGASFANASGSTGSGPTPGCTQAAELVYVLSVNNELLSFQPDKKLFTTIGTLGCNVPPGATPNSMAVDRNATAWVNYVANDGTADTAGWVYKVSTSDASCEATPSITLPNPSWYRLGMGFSTDTANGTTETLFVTGTGMVGSANSPGLGTIDLTAKKLTPIAQFTGDAKLTGQSAELTGTGDARLFGFFTTTPVRVAQIDKAGAKILNDLPVAGVPTPLAWAFSFWGGSFYLYTSPDGTTPSTVTKFDPATQSVDATYNLTAPVAIDGAGVSTCAPLTPTT
jgi:hypothetical protein